MPDTPLPARELLALADAAVVGRCQQCRRRVKLSSVNGERGHKSCNGPVRFGPMGEAYRAARAASPVTLEEALMDHLIAVERSNDTEDRIAAMGAIITHGRTINARRLAGEGGGL